MLNCIYHPDYGMRVVEDDEYERLLLSGGWFKHPNDIKKIGDNEHEVQFKREHNEKRRGRPCKQKSVDV